MAVAGVLAQADVGPHHQLGGGGLDRPDRLGDRTVRDPRRTTRSRPWWRGCRRGSPLPPRPPPPPWPGRRPGRQRAGRAPASPRSAARSPVPGTTKSGSTKEAGWSRVSATVRRKRGVRRSRRCRAVGKVLMWMGPFGIVAAATRPATIESMRVGRGRFRLVGRRLRGRRPWSARWPRPRRARRVSGPAASRSPPTATRTGRRRPGQGRGGPGRRCRRPRRPSRHRRRREPFRASRSAPPAAGCTTIAPAMPGGEGPGESAAVPRADQPDGGAEAGGGFGGGRPDRGDRGRRRHALGPDEPQRPARGGQHPVGRSGRRRGCVSNGLGGARLEPDAGKEDRHQPGGGRSPAIRSVASAAVVTAIRHRPVIGASRGRLGRAGCRTLRKGRWAHRRPGRRRRGARLPTPSSTKPVSSTDPSGIGLALTPSAPRQPSLVRASTARSTTTPRRVIGSSRAASSEAAGPSTTYSTARAPCGGAGTISSKENRWVTASSRSSRRSPASASTTASNHRSSTIGRAGCRRCR